MPAPSASGNDATPNGGTAKSRDHNQGNQDKKYTVEQKTAVIRVRKCTPTAFYEILGLEKTASDGEIKKAYRKLSLLTHPDKNGCEGADEAFKMVSRAFQILSDSEKKERFDRYGGDPDSRFGAGAPAASPFGGFARSSGGRGQMYDEGLTPEELFRRFFDGEMGGPFGGGGLFNAGPQFVFNMGGGPGIRVHQFGGGMPRRRPRDANGRNDDRPQSLLGALSNLLPLLILFILPLLSSLFSSAMSSGPNIQFHPAPPNTLQRTSHRLKVDYYVNPRDVSDYNNRKYQDLDRKAENQFITNLQYECQMEHRTRERLYEEAQGWFFQDEQKMREAREYDLRACRRLENFGYSGRY